MPDSIPGDSSSPATLAIGGTASSTIDHEADSDWFNVNLVAGFGYQIWLEGAGAGKGTLADPMLMVMTSQGHSVDIDDNTYGLDSYLNFVPGETASFFLATYSSDLASTGTYEIRIESDELESVASQAFIVPDTVAYGSLGHAGDMADWHAVELVAGQTYLFDMTGTADDGYGHQTLVDPWLGLHAPSGLLIVADDNSGLGQNARLMYTPTESGTYFLDAQEAGQDALGTYRLAVNTQPVSGSLSIDSSTGGAIDFVGDANLYSIAMVAGTTYDIWLEAYTLTDPFLEILGPSGEVIAQSDNAAGAGLGSRVAFLAPVTGTYYALARASGNDATGLYSIGINPAQLGDPLEPNNTGGTATVLGEISGTVTHANLSIETGDVDLFRFTLANPGRVGDSISVGFSHAQGDIDIALYTSGGTTLLLHSAGSSNEETISLEGLAAGTYLLQVYGYNGAANPGYSLGIHVSPYIPVPDVLEENDTPATAKQLGTVLDSVMWSGLSAQSGDPDWFRFTLAHDGRAGDEVLVAFLHALGDVDVALYAANGTTLLASSTGIEDHERISLAGRAAGEYLIRVDGYNGAANPGYSISVTVAPRVALPDRFEPNDEHTSGTSLGTISGTRTEAGLSAEAGNADWFTFAIAGTGRAGDYVAVDFTHALGDIDIALFNLTTQSLAGVSQTGGDREQVSLAGLDAGVYAVVIGGLNGSSNPDYKLTVNFAPVVITADRFEPNNSADFVSNLGTAGGTRSEGNLTMEVGGFDWYRFTLGQQGRAGDAFSIAYNQLQGDIDLELYNATGTSILARSYNTTGEESISLSGLAAGTYLARVFGWNGAGNPYYSLKLVAAMPATPDRNEPNNSLATATDLRTIIGPLTKYNLSVEPNDSDWFRFTLPGTGQAGDTAGVTFNHAYGDVDIELSNAAGTVIGRSNSIGNAEEISLAGLAAGSYSLRVFGHQGASNPSYDLRMNIAPAIVGPDVYENNDTHGTASQLRTLAGPRTISALTVQSNDEDWYRFTIANHGTAGEGASITFNGQLGDVDMKLYNATGTTELMSSLGRGDSEAISFNGLSAGTYLLKVYGSGSHSNPDYALRINARPAAPPADYDEENDSRSTPYNLRDITSTHTRTSLTMQPNDEDWYQFNLADFGRSTDTARIEFLNSQGDIDLYLYNPAGTLLASSTTTGNFEQVSLAGLFGTYFIKVAGYNGAQNNDYTLRLSGPDAILNDNWEYNDEIAFATPLRKLTNNVTGATLTRDDKDYYEFVLGQMGGTGDKVQVRADRPGVSVKVLDAGGNFLYDDAITDANGQATISLHNFAAGHWIIEVETTAQAPVARYDMDVRARGASDKAGWTIMVYLAGDNDLEGAAIADLNEMEAAAERDGVNVVVMFDRGPGHDNGHGNWTGTRGGFVSHDWWTWSIGSDLADWDEWNMGAASTLTSFIDWAALEAPADKYMLVVWNHGGAALAGVAFDDTSGGDSLSTAELREAIENSNIGKIDILGFDACLMATVEVAAELNEVVTYMVASERTVPGEGWDYQPLLESVYSTSNASFLTGKIVDTYIDSVDDNQHLSATKLSDIAALETAIDSFVAVIRAGNGADWRAAGTARTRAKTSDADYTDFVDLGSYMRALKTVSANAALDNAAQAVIDAVDKAVVNNAGLSGYYGLTIYFPRRSGEVDGEYTAANFDFLLDTNWGLFLADYQNGSLAAAGGWEAGEMDFAESLTLDGRAAAFGNDAIETPYRLGTINQADYAVTGLSLDYEEDVDWYTFDLPAGTGRAPEVEVRVLGGVAGVRAQLLALDGTPIAERTSTGAQGALVFTEAVAGTSYLLQVTGLATTEMPHYELHFDAFGDTAAAVALPDRGESEGGNQSMAKAWEVGTAQAIANVGGIRNLSIDADDLAAGADGGDWFRVDTTRVTESNVNLLEIVDVTNGAPTLSLKVYDLMGALLAQSSAPGDLSVAFAPPAADVFVQVQSSGAAPVHGYTLKVLNDRTGPTIHAVEVSGATGSQNSTLAAGDTISVSVLFSELVTVGGAPSLALLVGSSTVQAVYAAGSGTDTITFTYTVQAGNTDTNGLSIGANGISLNGGSISDAAGNPAVTTHLPLSDMPAYKVDTTAPVVATFTPADEATSIAVGTNIQVTFSEAVTPVAGNIVLKVAGGAVVETFNVATSPRLAFSSTGVVVDPTADLAAGTSYQLVFDAGAVMDAAGNPFAGSSSYSFTTFLAGQTFNGSAGANAVLGTPGNDTVLAAGGNDTITGGLGDDDIDGGDGRDYAAYSGPRADYTVTRLGDFNAIVSGPDGTDSLTNVERLQFSDVFVALDINGNGGQAYRLYKAALDRAPDIGGLGFQINVLDIGFGITDIAANFIESPEFQARYGNLSNAQFVNQLYLNVLDRPADQGGLDFHVNNLNLGLPRNYLLVQFSESGENQVNVIGDIGNGMSYTL